MCISECACTCVCVSVRTCLPVSAHVCASLQLPIHVYPHICLSARVPLVGTHVPLCMRVCVSPECPPL